MSIESEIEKLNPDMPLGELSKAIREILSRVAQCESATEREICLEQIKAKTKRTMEALRTDLDAIMRIQAAPQGHYQVVEGSSRLINPSMTFQDGVGYLCVNLKVKRRDTGTVIDMPHVVTSKRELIQVSDADSFEPYNLFPTSLPSILSKGPLWPHHLMKEYLAGKVTVAPKELLLRLERIYDRYLDFQDPDTPLVLALYTMGTHFYRLFESYPYFYIFGQRGSGKTKCLLVAKNLCYNAIMASDITSSATFRTIEQSSCTLLIDEAERLKGRNADEDLIRLLNSGYKRGSCAIRTDPETLRVQAFDTYSPKILAGIKGIDDVLADRCITITMIRTTDSKKANLAVTERGEKWGEVRHLLYCFALDHFEGAARSYDEIINRTEKDSPIIGRTAELWMPLFSIAHYVDSQDSGRYSERIRSFALQSLKESKRGVLDEWSAVLLRSLADLARNTQETFFTMTTEGIRKLMLPYLDEDENTTSIRSMWIGQELRRLKIGVKNRTRTGVTYTFTREEVLDRARRYLPDVEEGVGV